MTGEASTTRPMEPVAASAACDTGPETETTSESGLRWYWFGLPETMLGLSFTLQTGFRLVAKDYYHFVALWRWPGYVLATIMLCIMVLAVTLRNRIVWPSKNFRLFWLAYDGIILIVYMAVFMATT